MTLEELAKELAAGDFRPAYLLAGEEALLRDEARVLLRGAVLDGAADDFNYLRLDSESATPSSMNDALEALPIMAPRRLVELRLGDLRRSGVKALLDALAEALPAHLGQRDTVLVVIATAGADKRQRWVKALGKAPAAIVACDPPKDGRGAVAFVREEAKRQRVDLDRGAAERLVELVGPRLLLLRQEVAKAALLAGPGETVKPAHVDDATTQSADQPVWDLNDAVAAGDTVEALRILARLKEEVFPPVLLGLLASHFRKLSRVRDGGKVNGPPFARKKLESQARRYSPERLRASMRAIHATDIALKGAGELAPDLAIERLVLALSS
jgi:DNA polymerase-3 subunit delta